ncbi:MAG: class I SAM-dependent methyltransferase [Nitrospinae bacterium]|nr:class I SAM-dependent methyltransferase [Nitrospinota bacterium]
MIEDNNPEIDQKEIIKKVEKIVSGELNAHEQDFIDISKQFNERNKLTSEINKVNSLLDILEKASKPRTKIPMTLDRFPFNKSKKLQSFILKLYEIIFREQREINYSVLESLRAFYTVSQEVSILRNEVTALIKKNNDLFAQVNYQSRELAKYRQTFKKTPSQQENNSHSTTSAKTISEQEVPSDPEAIDMDSLYLSAMDTFRGSREDIIERAQVYLKFFNEANAGTKERPIIDLGSGRGELLEVLKKSGKIARGVEQNKYMLAECKQMNLEVIDHEAIEYLNTLPDNSVGAVTALHLVEHLPFNELLNFLKEVLRVLQNDGVAIFETPNPENIIVSSYTFNFDPTHLKPIPADYLKFLMETIGFSSPETLKLHEPEESKRINETTETAIRVNHFFYGAQDYALVAYKK